ncbi:MAG: cytochrome c biogenesis protein CcsA [Rhodospirillaceae bacterium]
MTATNLITIAGFMAVLPTALATATGRVRAKSGAYGALLAVAVAGTVLQFFAIDPGWHTDFAFSLWISVASGLAVFAAAGAVSPMVPRLAPLFLTLMAALAFLAMAASLFRPSSANTGLDLSAWLWVHIAVSVLTYAFLTIAAVAAFAALIQERALKRKTPLKRLDGLPAVLECEALVLRYLTLSLIVLVVGLASGIGINLVGGAAALTADHKTVFTLIALTVIGGLLAAHRLSGARGRQVARLVLAAYLCVTLAYPGVKFVTDVLLAY